MFWLYEGHAGGVRFFLKKFDKSGNFKRMHEDKIFKTLPKAEFYPADQNSIKIKGSLSSSWMNSPMPILWQNESLSETIGMKICHLHGHSHENQVIFMGNIWHKHSFCK